MLTNSNDNIVWAFPCGTFLTIEEVKETNIEDNTGWSSRGSQISRLCHSYDELFQIGCSVLQLCFVKTRPKHMLP